MVTGRGVFDGNVKVERLAQQTDAQQLSRNLLLVKNATVNVKPNLQIIADDVKCTHGCTVSDLEENQLFYFRCETYRCMGDAAGTVLCIEQRKWERLQAVCIAAGRGSLNL